MRRLKYAVVGYGNRGRGYTDYAERHPEEYEVIAVVEKNPQKTAQLDRAKVKVYENLNDFIAEKLEIDIVCVATQDSDHYENAIALLKAGYDLILEKPISNTLENCIGILEAGKLYKKKIFICHVLRYTPFYKEIKRQLLENSIGKIINIQTSENIGYWHMAHSYVRGPWRNKELSSPIILAKCCHDLDLICWFMDEECNSVNSIGSLSYFKRDNKPEGSAAYCSDCAVRDHCNYDVMKIYPDHPWTNLYYMTEEPTVENISKKIRHTQYDRCVYNCDNDVCDHQSVIINFKSGAIATHTLSAFSQRIYRTIHIQGTEGELFGTFDEDKNLITLRRFDGTIQTIDTNKFMLEGSPHGGGDAAFMREVFNVMNGQDSISITTIDQSVLSHQIAFSAENSRTENGKTIFLT